MIKRMFIFIPVLYFISCQNKVVHQPIEESRFLMDTMVRIVIYNSTISEDSTRFIIDQAFQLMKRLEQRLSINIDTSELNQIGMFPQSVSNDLFNVIQISQKIADETKGALDITIGSVKSLWNFYGDAPQVPDSNMIQNALKHVNYNNIYFQDDQVWIANFEVKIDLGAVAKGYIVDQAIAYFKISGIREALIEAGGDLRIVGPHPENKYWRIGIRHPRPEFESMFGIFQIDSGAVATSGDYERFFIEDGHRYHHILDPGSGFPAAKCVSVTILANTAAEADGYATAVFVMGPVKGYEFLKSNPEIEGLILYYEEETLKMKITDNFKNQLKIS